MVADDEGRQVGLAGAGPGVGRGGRGRDDRVHHGLARGGRGGRVLRADEDGLLQPDRGSDPRRCRIPRGAAHFDLQGVVVRHGHVHGGVRVAGARRVVAADAAHTAAGAQRQVPPQRPRRVLGKRHARLHGSGV